MISRYGSAPWFVPASLNRHVVRFGYPVALALARLRYSVEVQVSADDLARLEALAGTRSILLANHPAPHDWLCFYLLSAKLRTPLHYMTAHEQFAGARRFWLPLFGAYSIRRGGWGDVAAVRETMRLLSRSACSLVMFPEGRCSFWSSTLMEFKVGAARIGLGLLDRIAASRGSAPDLFLVPVAIRYEYTESIDRELRSGVARLERHLGTVPVGSLAQRMHNLVRDVVARLELQYGLAPSARQSEWRARIEMLCQRILLDLERVAGIHRAPRQGLADRACNLRQRLAVHGHCFGVRSKSAYERFYFPTLVVLLLESIGRWHAAAEPAPLEQADLLWALERIVYEDPDPPPKGRRKATLCVADSVNLRQLLPEYRADRRGTARRVVAAAQAGMEKRLMPEGKVSGAAASALARAALPG